jgi:NTE family protein
MTMRALVLGGGGPVGVAWQTGLIAGFAQAGIDLAGADYVLGTSAGSIVGARLRLAAEPASLAEPLLAPRAPQAGASNAGGPAPGPGRARMMELLAETQNGARSPAEVRRELGALALSAATMPEPAYLAMIGGALRVAEAPPWPERAFACTAVDAEDGGFQLWRAASGAELLPAVASSCAVPGVFPPVALHGRRYMDGGMRSMTNADLAAGYEVVVIVAVRSASFPAFALRQLEAEVESLKADGAIVALITPDAAAAEAMGLDFMDFGRNAAVAQAGLAQAAAQAEVLRSAWGE